MRFSLGSSALCRGFHEMAAHSHRPTQRSWACSDPLLARALDESIRGRLAGLFDLGYAIARGNFSVYCGANKNSQWGGDDGNRGAGPRVRRLCNDLAGRAGGVAILRSALARA